ncbi:Flippase [Priestia megaterium]|uniref:oligosaccharide flippase family protein n=1 Tax=Priestia megaterium TaxID=1404 RepID=UPI0039DFA94A
MKINSLAVKNIFQMGIIQLINYAFPLVTVPYLLRTIGVSNYGLLSVEISIVQILLILSDYGFAFTATQKIALNKKIDNQLVSIIYSFKAIIGSVILLMYIILITVSSFSVKTIIFHLGFFLFFQSQSLIPVWLFRGLNKLWYVSFLTILTKILTLILMLLFVRTKNDFYLLGIVYALPTILTCVIAQLFGRRLGVKFEKVKVSSFIGELKEGKDIFISNAVGTLYTSLNTVIVSFFGGSYAAGIYATCEKVVGVINSLTNAVSQAVYPIVCKKIVEVRTRKGQIRVPFKYFGWWVICTFIGGLLIIILAPVILEIITGKKQTGSQILTLQIMSFIPFLISLGHLLGIQTLIPLNNKTSVRVAVTYGAVTNITLGMILSYFIHAPGTALAIVACELVVVVKELYSINSYLKYEKGEAKFD